MQEVREDLYMERMRANQQGLQGFGDHRGRNLRRLQPLGERLAPAADAFVREDLQQGGRTLSDPALGKCKRFRERALEYMYLQIGYFHCRPPHAWLGAPAVLHFLPRAR